MINAVRERAFTQTIAPWKAFLELAMVGRDVDETLLMEKVPATGGKPARCLIRQGQYITVGELFVFGARSCSCGNSQARAAVRVQRLRGRCHISNYVHGSPYAPPQ